LRTERVWPYAAFGLCAVLYLGLTTFSRRLERAKSPLYMAITVGDLLLVTTAVWLTGDPHSEYYLLYYIPIIHAGVRLRPRDGATAAVLATTLYLFVLTAEAHGQPYGRLAPLRAVNLLAPATVLVVFFSLLRREEEMSNNLRLALHDGLRRYSAVYDVAHAANVGADISDVLSILLDHAAQAVAAQAGAIALLQPGEGLRVVTVTAPAGEAEGASVDCTSDPARRALASGSAIVVNAQSLAAKPQANSQVYLPLIAPSGPIGVLGLAAATPRKLPRKQVEFLRSLCAEAAIALENAQLRSDLRRLAVTDYLTGLPNRREIERRLRVELEAAKRYCRPLTILMLDCDGLKRINDRGGHATGDALLCALARVLEVCLRTPDSAGRIGRRDGGGAPDDPLVRRRGDAAVLPASLRRGYRPQHRHRLRLRRSGVRPGPHGQRRRRLVSCQAHGEEPVLRAATRGAGRRSPPGPYFP
jgi:predicted signal transduction protein with EAL and GGDEF domain